MIARVPDDSDVRYCFCSRCLEISRNVVVDCWKIFSSTKTRFALVMQNTLTDHLYHNYSNLEILKLRCIPHLVKLCHSKRDYEYRRVYGWSSESYYILQPSNSASKWSLEPNRAVIFRTTKNLFWKGFDSAGKLRDLWSRYSAITYCLLWKYPEWSLWRCTTRLVVTIDCQINENAEIHPFGQTAHSHSYEKDIKNNVISVYRQGEFRKNPNPFIRKGYIKQRHPRIQTCLGWILRGKEISTTKHFRSCTCSILHFYFFS